ncbi:MAG: zf-HC2 domain-containing protein [FCB group bacterium]|nr:zf-HC2 domain-containing protein [FCB group bacterium]
MTCRFALLLLDDYVDNELAPKEREALKKHLEDCSSCRQEWERTKYLKELLKQKLVNDPGEDYWKEMTNIILARTIETSSRESVTLSFTEKAAMQRGAFIRSLVSAGVSVIILVSAIILGTAQKKSDPTIYAGGNRLFAAASLKPPDKTVTTIITKKEQINQAQGMLLMGAPTFIGRFSTIFEFINSGE